MESWCPENKGAATNLWGGRGVLEALPDEDLTCVVMS